MWLSLLFSSILFWTRQQVHLGILASLKNWVGGPNSDSFFFLGNNVVLFVFCVMFLYMFQKKMDRGVGGYCLANSSFSRIFGFFLT